MKHEPPPKPDRPDRGRDFAELLIETTELQMQICKRIRFYASILYGVVLFHVTAMVVTVVLVQYLLNHVPDAVTK